MSGAPKACHGGRLASARRRSPTTADARRHPAATTPEDSTPTDVPGIQPRPGPLVRRREKGNHARQPGQYHPLQREAHDGRGRLYSGRFPVSLRAGSSALPVDKVKALVQRQAPWQEMLDLISAAAPLGFLIYFWNDVDPVVQLAGDTASGVAYLMGNRTTMERMYRYEPAVIMYAPLHTVIWGDAEGPAHFTFDKPSDQFGSFADSRITAVGEVDRELAALLEHLGVAVPDELVAG
jgi:hypothetical protein